MSTDAKRRGNAAAHARRAEAGLKKVTFWLTPESQVMLDALKEVHGSKDAAVNAAIKALSEAR